MSDTNLFPPDTRSKNGDWFVRSSYWARWSRSLIRMGLDSETATEISLEPMNYIEPDPTKRLSDYELDRLLEMRIRCHRTHEGNDRFTKILPGGTVGYIQAVVGEYFTNLLLHEDLLSEIDNSKMAYYDNCSNWPWGGGIPFAMVCKNRDKYPEVMEHWFKVMDKEGHYLRVQDDDMLRRYNERFPRQSEKEESK